MPINYPIKFKPILKERIWGGDKLHKLFGKEPQDFPVGESWEISAIPGSVSIVENGDLKGKSIQFLIDTYKEKFLGEIVFKKYGTHFPLLVKFIDATEDLSVQLHPNDQLAFSRHNCSGKEEMWYILNAEKDSHLYFGFNKELTKETYASILKDKLLPTVLHHQKVKKGAIYHIPTGRVHAIGRGIVLAEIQQSSDITYRLFDWERKDSSGKKRKLHTELALDAIDFTIPTHFETFYRAKENFFSPVLDSNYFKTKILNVATTKHIATSSKDSFTIYMCVKGKGGICNGTHTTKIKMGECILIPASFKKYTINPDPKMTLLYIKAV
jgi:mannose-6-phosphate isomerase